MFLTEQGNKHWTNWTTTFLKHLRALHHIAHPAQNIVQSTALQLWTTRIMDYAFDSTSGTDTTIFDEDDDEPLIE